MVQRFFFLMQGLQFLYGIALGLLQIRLPGLNLFLLCRAGLFLLLEIVVQMSAVCFQLRLQGLGVGILHQGLQLLLGLFFRLQSLEFFLAQVGEVQALQTLVVLLQVLLRLLVGHFCLLI